MRVGEVFVDAQGGFVGGDGLVYLVLFQGEVAPVGQGAVVLGVVLERVGKGGFGLRDLIQKI